MNAIFLVADSPISPHYCHKAWAKTFCKTTIRTPFPNRKNPLTWLKWLRGIELPKADVLFCESSYCLPTAKKHKKKHDSKIILLVADTTYLPESHSIFKWLYVRYYTKFVDGFICVSKRIMKDIMKFSRNPIEVVRPFAVEDESYAYRKLMKIKEKGD